MTQRALLLSDLHLPAAASPLRAAFLRFLAGPARDTEALYLLGDIFEYWIGDDVGLQVYADEVEALAALHRCGVELYVMHGNRDFLLGPLFCAASGARLLADPVVRIIGGVPTLLSHGDAWCSDDRAYQHWRRFSRNRFAQWLFLRLPRARRERIAGGVRGSSAQAKQVKPEEIMDVNAGALAAAFLRYGVTRIIHGHTHRPAEHCERIDGREVERIVLADWRADRMEYLLAENGGLRRLSVDGRA